MAKIITDLLSFNSIFIAERNGVQNQSVFKAIIKDNINGWCALKRPFLADQKAWDYKYKEAS